MSVEIDETFGFRVTKDPADGEIEVSLPHQCGRWMIAKTYQPDEAIEALESFIGQAVLALARLKELSAPLPG